MDQAQRRLHGIVTERTRDRFVVEASPVSSMTKKSDHKPAAVPAKPAPVAVTRKSRRIVSALARSTLLAAGFAVAQLGIPEIDSRFHLFDPTLLDRLQSPISRYHE